MTSAPIAVPCGRRVSGRLRPPSSKSVTHRLALLAFSARRETVIERPLDAVDTRLLAAALRALGVRSSWEGDRLVVAPDRRPPGEPRIECGNAGTLFRLLTGTLAATTGRFLLDGSARLRERPIAPLVDGLRALGAAIEYVGEPDRAPLMIEGGRLAGRARLDAGASSQFLSALLLAGVAAAGPIEIEVERLVSAPYVRVTRQCVEMCGGRIEVSGRLYRVQPGLDPPARLEVEADYSAAAYPAAAAVVSGGEVRLAGLRRDSPQGDAAFLDLLAAMGAEVARTGDEVAVASGRPLVAVEADLGEMPDQVPTLAALAPFARGTTVISGVPHLRFKESDRLGVMARELDRLGAVVEERDDGLVIEGSWAEAEPPAEPVVADPHDDHRVAMSLALVGLRRPGVSIGTPEVVEKSYPAFWDDLAGLLGDRGWRRR